LNEQSIFLVCFGRGEMGILVGMRKENVLVGEVSEGEMVLIGEGGRNAYGMENTIL